MELLCNLLQRYTLFLIYRMDKRQFRRGFAINCYFCSMYEYADNDLGKIIIVPDKRVRNIIARKKVGYIQMTVPLGFSEGDLPRVLQRIKPRLLQLHTPVHKIITDESVIHTHTFTIHIYRHERPAKAFASFKNECLAFSLPQDTDMAQPGIQHWMKETIIAVLRKEARRLLTQKTAFFADKFGLHYHQVKINRSKTRWGSCSTKKNINYSLFLLFLPEKYIDYVVLHELAHTVEMNHGKKFWTLLDALCGCPAKELSKSIKNFHSESYDYFRDA
ncbi:MAG TPA: hypothetical protein DEG28_03525 [Porphyromonadaceae bacterium]|nr:hypothetical protein [Porphyromonadaceae bacterium]